MKVSVKWLSKYVDLPDDLDRLTDRLTNIGLNLEDIQQVGNDTVLDLEVTSNRPDCLSHIGVAREISAALGLELKLPQIKFQESDRTVQQYCCVDIECPDLCPRYTARIIDNVKVGPSPRWLTQSIETLGLRSVNNVVDVTNFVLLEMGQPLHAFDYHKLTGGKIIVRTARSGEQITAIDQSRHPLNDLQMIIADASLPVAVAGVMGGADTEVSSDTTCVLLESAQFDPLSVRRTARALNLHSESSFRFERGIDPAGVDSASRRAAGLIAELAGRTVAKGVIDLWPGKAEPATITLKRSAIKRLLGIELDWLGAQQILKNLGFQLLEATDDQLTVRVPSHRRDVSRPVDLIEELGRMEGYDKVPTGQTIRLTAQPSSHLENLSQLVGDSLNACGFFEIVTPTFQQDSHARLLVDVPPERMLRVADHLSRQWNILRSSLLPSLLEVRRLNQDAGSDQSDLYEISRIFLPSQAGKLPNEQRSLALLCCRDLRVIFGALEQIVQVTNAKELLRFKPVKLPWYLSGSSAEVFLDDKVIGQAGVITAQIQDMFELRAPVALAQISFDALLALPVEPPKYQPLPRFPAIDRDLSLVFDEQVRWQDVQDLIISTAGNELEQVQFIDLFRGRQIPRGKKSITLSLRFRRSDGSLTHEQAEEFQALILSALEKKLNAVLRAQ